jgi:hypothetical protein
VRLGAPLPQYALPGTTIGAWVQRSEGSSAAYPVREETTNFERRLERAEQLAR